MTLPFRRIRHLLIDLDGVIYRGETALPGAREFVHMLHDQAISFRLVTNNATLTPAQYVDKLGRMGIEVSESEVFTSALATGMFLKQERNGTRTAYVVGEEGLRQAVRDAGLDLVPDNPDWVVVGLDRQVTYGDLAEASLAVERGARFVGTNPDLSYPTEDGLLPGAGSLIGVIEATTRVQPRIIGKPEPLMLQLAMHSLGGSLENTAMLGDRLDTDIEAAARFGMLSILVLTGVSTRADLESFPTKPTLVVENLADLMRQWGAAVPG
jgi:HAD superfamily hydrolase (TIGR01457 family)